MTKKLQLLAYTLLMAVIIFAAYKGLIPTKLHDIPFYDSAGHFVLYGLWGYFFGNAFSSPIFQRNNFNIQIGVIITVMIAIIEESIQLLFPVRSFSVYDLAFGLTGIGLSCIILNIESYRKSF